MTKVMLVLLSLVWAHLIHAQQLIVRQSDSAGYFSFVKASHGKSLRYQGSYDILRETKIHYMIRWGVSGNAQIYWTNGENIYTFNPGKTEESKLVYSHLFFILEFVVRNLLHFHFQTILVV